MFRCWIATVQIAESHSAIVMDYICLERTAERCAQLRPEASGFEELLEPCDHEMVPVESDLTPSEVFGFLDRWEVTRALGLTSFTAEDALLDVMERNRLVSLQPDGRYAITHLGAILFAKDLRAFSRTMWNIVGIIQYDGCGRSDINRMVEGVRGYAVQFERTVEDLTLLLPTHQRIVGGIMRTFDRYPLEVIRELLANAMVHQDFAGISVHVTVGIFDDRIEITNPGCLSVGRLRIIDQPARIRNRGLCESMRRLGFFEGTGSGWDRIVEICDKLCIPVPQIQAKAGYTRITVFGKVPFDDMSREDRMWACYAHACIRHTKGLRVTNATLRARFGLDPSRHAAITGLLKAACDASLIRVSDDAPGSRPLSYVPFWADPR